MKIMDKDEIPLNLLFGSNQTFFLQSRNFFATLQAHYFVAEELSTEFPPLLPVKEETEYFTASL